MPSPLNRSEAGLVAGESAVGLGLGRTALRNCIASSTPSGELNQWPPWGYSLHATWTPNFCSASRRFRPPSTNTVGSSEQCSSYIGVLRMISSRSGTPSKSKTIRVSASDIPGKSIRHEKLIKAPRRRGPVSYVDGGKFRFRSVCTLVAAPWLIPANTRRSYLY